MFSTVEKIIREPDLVRSTGSAVAYFYVLFYAFFEFVVLAVYVSACNFWHIAPFLSYYMCTRQSAVSGSPSNVVIYNMPNFLSKKTQMPLHAAAAFEQRKEFFGGESVLCILCIGKISLPHFLYTVYQIFRCTQIFVGFFCWQQKKHLTALFSNTETFFFCVLSYVFQCICLGINHIGSIHLWH